MTAEEQQQAPARPASSAESELAAVPPTALEARAAKWAGPILRRIPDEQRDFFLRGLAIFTGRRVPGLAAEAAFWAVFSLPWLILALVSGLGLISRFWVDDPLDTVKVAAENLSQQVLTPEAAAQYAQPIIEDFSSSTRPDLGVLGLILAIWAGSRAVLTYVDAIMLINGEFGARGYARRRLLSVALYIVGAVLAIVMVPLIVIGPQKVGEWLNLPTWSVTVGYFVLSVVVALILLVFLFHYAAKKKHSAWASLPGALLAVVSSAFACLILTFYVRRLFSQSSIYGVLATPIALMIFAYVLSLMVLIGATYNAVRSDREIFRSTADPRGRFRRSSRVVERLSAHPDSNPSVDSDKPDV